MPIDEVVRLLADPAPRDLEALALTTFVQSNAPLIPANGAGIVLEIALFKQQYSVLTERFGFVQRFI
jgi:succinate-acetate transporter protein